MAGRVIRAAGGARRAVGLAALVVIALAMAASAPAHAQGGKKAPVGGGGSAPAAPRSIFEPLPTDDDQYDAPSMHFTAIKRGQRTMIFAWGHIQAGDAAKLDRAIQEATPVEEIGLISGGGNLEEGLQMGRLIHSHHLTTHLSKGMICISACNFVFLGGTIRMIDVGAEFKVHMFAQPNRAVVVLAKVLGAPNTIAEWNTKHREHPIDPDEYKDWNHEHSDIQLNEAQFVAKSAIGFEILDIQQDSAQTAAEIARFLSEMSISLRFLTEFANIPNETPRALTRDELRDFNIVNVD